MSDIRSFTAIIAEHRKGSLVSDLSEKLAQVAEAVMEHDKAGALTLTLKITPSGDGTTVKIDDVVKATIPEGTPATSLFFVDDAGNLTRHNPAQQSLLRDASDEKASNS